MIELVDVVKTYHAGQPNAVTAVDGVSLTVPLGGITVLKGPSGSGKTTLLAMMGGMTRPSSGRIFLDGHGLSFLPSPMRADRLDVSGLPERFLSMIRRERFGFVFQHSNLIPGVSVLDNVLLPALPSGRPRSDLERRARELMRQFGLDRYADTPAERLSGGERQRAAIARALVNDPQAVLADEPTAHLDSHLSAAFMDMAAGLKAAGKTLVIASHDPLVFGSPHVNRVVEVKDGRMVSVQSLV